MSFFESFLAFFKSLFGAEESPYRLTNNADENWQICTFSVSERLLEGEENILTFRGPNSQREKQTKMVKELFAIKGISMVEILDYQIRVAKAGVYNWNELINPVEMAIRRHLDQITA